MLTGNENIVAPPESFSGRTEYVMSPDLHMPVPIPPPINDLTGDNTGIELDTLLPRDFPDFFNLLSPQNSLSTLSENASESEE